MAKTIDFKLDDTDYSSLGRKALEKGEYEAAVEYFKTACGINDNSASYVDLAEVYNELNHPRATFATLFKALSKAVTEEDRNAVGYALALIACNERDADLVYYYLSFVKDQGAIDKFEELLDSYEDFEEDEPQFKIAKKDGSDFCLEIVDRARELYVMDKPVEALKLLGELTSRMPSMAKEHLAYIYRIEVGCYAALDDHKEMISILQKLSEIDPDHEIDHKIQLAGAYIMAGQRDKANAVIDEILAPATEDLHFNKMSKLLTVLGELKRDQDILDITEKFASVTTSMHYLGLYRGEALYNLGRKKDAIRTMTQLDNIFGEFSPAWLYLEEFESTPERIEYGPEGPAIVKVQALGRVYEATTALSKEGTDLDEATEILVDFSRKLFYDAGFNRDLRWVLNYLPDDLTLPVVSVLGGYRNDAIDKLFYERLISPFLTLDLLRAIVSFILDTNLRITFDVVTMNRYKNIDLRLPNAFYHLPANFQAAVFLVDCEIIYVDEEPNTFIERLAKLIDEMVEVGEDDKLVWKIKEGKKVARLKSIETMIAVLLSEVFAGDEVFEESDILSGRNIKAKTFQKYHDILFGVDKTKDSDE